MSVTVVDNDSLNFVLTDTPLEMDEGASKQFKVKLSAAPVVDTVVSMVSDNPDVTFIPDDLTFTVDDWQTDQSVRVSAAADDDAGQDTASITLTAHRRCRRPR